jgi:hypothetical protein
MQPLTFSKVQLLCTVKEKGRKPGRKPNHLFYVLRNPYRSIKSENSQYPETSTKAITPSYGLRKPYKNSSLRTLKTIHRNINENVRS